MKWSVDFNAEKNPACLICLINCDGVGVNIDDSSLDEKMIFKDAGIAIVSIAKTAAKKLEP